MSRILFDAFDAPVVPPVPPALFTPPTLFDPVPGNIGLIGDSMILMHFEEPNGVPPRDSAPGGVDTMNYDGNTPPTQVSCWAGRGLDFEGASALIGKDISPGSTLALQDVTIQTIVAPKSGIMTSVPGVVIQRGDLDGTTPESVAYGLDIFEFTPGQMTIHMFWSDSLGIIHRGGGATYQHPGDGEFVLITATRRWNSPTSATYRYYVADQLLGETTVTSSIAGAITGGTTGHTCIGASKSAGAWSNFLGAKIDDLRVVDYEMSHDEVRETWRRLSVHQPNGVAMFDGLSPPGVRWYKNPGNRIAAFVKIIGELLGVVIARTEELRANWLPDQAYADLIARWESVLEISAKPNDSLDTRRSRVIAFLSRLRGYSVPAIQQILSELLALLPAQIQILQFSNLITDTLATLNSLRWLTGSGAAWSIVGGQLQVLANAGSNIQWAESRIDAHVRMAIPQTTVRSAPRGPGALYAQVELASITSLGANAIVGLFLYNRATDDSIWFGVKNVAGTNVIGYQIYSAHVLGAFVTLDTPAPAAPIWLRVTPSALTDQTANLKFGYSTTGPTSGFTDSAPVATGIVPQHAGVAAMSTDSALAGNVQVTFANFQLLAYAGDRPFAWYAFRDPALSGTPDIAGAQLAIASARPAHTFAGVTQNTSVICDDPRDGLCDRGPCGGL